MSLADNAVIAASVKGSPFPTGGAGTRLHTLPFQCRMVLEPTAQALLLASAVTPFSCNVPAGAGTVLQAVPSKRSITALKWVSRPTAQMSLADVAETLAAGHAAEHHVPEGRASGEEQSRSAKDDGDPGRIRVFRTGARPFLPLMFVLTRSRTMPLGWTLSAYTPRTAPTARRAFLLTQSAARPLQQPIRAAGTAPAQQWRCLRRTKEPARPPVLRGSPPLRHPPRTAGRMRPGRALPIRSVRIRARFRRAVVPRRWASAAGHSHRLPQAPMWATGYAATRMRRLCRALEASGNFGRERDLSSRTAPPDTPDPSMTTGGGYARRLERAGHYGAGVGGVS
jgi:hypothetical protein